jgi:polyhydroxybutyrate depolymerase
MAELTAFNNLADTAGFIVVYPEGYERSWADGRNTTQAAQAGIDDVGFISALIDTLISNFSVDSARVYAAGISNGGNFVQRLGCELADKVVAIGVVAATSATDTALHCNPARPAPMTLMIGTEDTFFGVSETKNPDTLSADAAVAKRAALNGCAAKPSTTTLANIARDGTRVIRSDYMQCTSGADVQYYIITGGGHTWPGGLQYLPEAVVGRTSRDINASELLWQFFSAHKLSTL